MLLTFFYLVTHLPFFKSVTMQNALEWARLLQAICHATNKSPSCIVIEKGGTSQPLRCHLKANYHKEGELRPTLSVSMLWCDMSVKTRPLHLNILAYCPVPLHLFNTFFLVLINRRRVRDDDAVKQLETSKSLRLTWSW